MKIIHTSDWHLGARLLDQDRIDDNQRFLDELLGIIEKERPDALIVSGDVFDTRQPGSGVQSMYYNFLGKVNRSGACAQVVVTAGNHDSPSVLMEAHMPLDLIKVKVFGKVTDNPNDNIVVLDSADGSMKMAVAAVPFASGADLFNFARTAMPEAERPDARAGFAEYYRRIIESAKNQAAGGPVVVLGHCSVSGAKVSDDDSERGRSIGGIDVVDNSAFAGADYVALGHYHVPQDVGGSKTVRYSGSPIAMSFGEAKQRKSVTVVEFLPGREHDPEVRTIELTEYTPLRFFKGGTESVKEEVRKLRDEGPKCKIYIGVAITEGEDNLAEFWSDLEKMLEGSGIVVLKRENRRSRTEVPPIESIVESGDDITPVTVAKKVLDKNTGLSPECKKEYLDIIESIWRDVR